MRCFAAVLLAITLGLGLVPAPIAADDSPASRIVVGDQQEPATLDPVIATLAVESDAYNLLFDGLFRNDANGNLTPDLATRVPTQANGDISRDGLMITYHLVPNARWSDGQPITSRDVQFTWQAIMNPNNTVQNRTPYDQFARVDAPNPTTVVVHLKRVYAPSVLAAFTDKAQGAIVPAHVLAQLPDLNHAAFSTQPVTSGPYRLESWVRGSSMTFDANPAYFRGAPKIGRIVERFIPDQNAIANSIRAHELDLATYVSPTTYAQLGHIDGLTATHGSSMIWEHLAFTSSREPLSDARVRRALCMGIDTADIFQKVIHGAGDLGVGLQNPHSPWYLTSLRPCPNDLVAAGKLLDAAGWRMGPNGMRMKDGKPLQVTFGTVAGVIDRQQTQVLIQSRWRDLGVDTVVRTYPPALFFAPKQNGGIVYGGTDDVTLFAFFFDSIDPTRLEELSAQRVPPGGQNTAYWTNARVSQLEEDGVRTLDPVRRRRDYDEVQRIVAAEVPYITLRWWDSIMVHSTKLTGIKPPLVGSFYWNVRDWTI